jgi:hypothetical protein
MLRESVRQRSIMTRVKRRRTNNIVLGSPKINVDGIENGQEREPPGDTIDDNALSLGEELVDDSTEEEEMYKRPDEESPGGGSDIGLLAVIVNALGCSNSVDVRAEEDEIDDNVDDFEKDAVLPGVCHGDRGARGKAKRGVEGVRLK